MAEMQYNKSMNSCIYIELASDNVHTCISREHKHLRGRGVESRGHNLILKSRLFDAHCACVPSSMSQSMHGCGAAPALSFIKDKKKNTTNTLK